MSRRGGGHSLVRLLAHRCPLVRLQLFRPNCRSLHLLEHLLAKRKNEREPEIPLHAAHGNSDEPTLGVQHAAAGHAGVAVRQTGDQPVGSPLADVPGRYDDALRVVVAETEDRIGKLELIVPPDKSMPEDRCSP